MGKKDFIGGELVVKRDNKDNECERQVFSATTESNGRILTVPPLSGKPEFIPVVVLAGLL